MIPFIVQDLDISWLKEGQNILVSDGRELGEWKEVVLACTCGVHWRDHALSFFRLGVAHVPLESYVYY